MQLRRITTVTVVLFFASLTSSSHAGEAFPDPAGGWDYTFNGDQSLFGSGGFTSLDGTWAHEEADRWDGSAPGVTSDPAVDPDGASPGGVGVLEDGDTTFLRIQDTGEPRDHGWNEDTGNGIFSNRRINFGHDITSDPGNAGASGVLDGGLTLSFRARIATTAPLDDEYPEGAVTSSPWPAGGKGYDLGDDARGMFGVGQNGSQTLGFTLSLSSDTPGDVGSGLVMNNKSTPVDTESATPETVNLVPLSDSDLTDWHEFYLTVQDNGADAWEVSVWSDGSNDADMFVAAKANSADYDGEKLMMGLASGSRFGAYDIDFVSYKLGVHPVPEPSTLALVLMGLCGVGLSARRRVNA